MKKTIVIMTMLAMVGLLFTPASANLMLNADVETDSGSGTPASWGASGTGVETWATDESRSTSHSLKIEDNGSTYSYWSQWVTGLSGGTDYDFGGYFKTANNGSGSAPRAQLQALWYNGSTHLGTSSTSSGGVYDWKYVGLDEITAPTGTTRARFQFFTYRNQGFAWGDDFYFDVTPEPATMTLLLLGLPLALRRRRK
ncbi:MAG: PEP-CTERM sorting domain-containing protein [Phycisphaerae bacterium]|nr:PEP-CTERM sorting domain-containing protein [Phycisphaerae bacterium]